MEHTSKVTKAEATGRSFETQYGKFYDHTLEFEDGNKGVYSSKSDVCKYKIGDTVTFTVTKNGNFPDKIKPVQTKGNFGGGNGGGGNWNSNKDQGAITALSCISSACTLYSLQKGFTPEQVLEAAEKFFVYATSKSTVKPEETSKA